MFRRRTLRTRKMADSKVKPWSDWPMGLGKVIRHTAGGHGIKNVGKRIFWTRGNCEFVEGSGGSVNGWCGAGSPSDRTRVKERKGFALPSIPLSFFCAVDSRDSSLSSRSRSRGSFLAGYLLDRKAVGFGGRELLNQLSAGF